MTRQVTFQKRERKKHRVAPVTIFSKKASHPRPPKKNQAWHMRVILNRGDETAVKRARIACLSTFVVNPHAAGARSERGVDWTMTRVTDSDLEAGRAHAATKGGKQGTVTIWTL